MVRTICKDILFLGQKAEMATENDVHVARDLLDTLNANQSKCVGMAANMIGVNKRIIVINAGIVDMPMLNPRIIHGQDSYVARESCLSLTGERKATRYRTIEVEYQDLDMKKQRQTFTGWLAQIIQHEIDHCEGIII